MQRNVLEYIEETVKRVPNKIAFANEDSKLTFGELYKGIQAIGSALDKKGYYKEPVLVFMNKSPETIEAFFGAVIGGCFYVPLDEDMPVTRIEKIIENTKARVLICDKGNEEKVTNLGFTGEILLATDLVNSTVNVKRLEEIRKAALDTDPIYILFTSGSTGVPKGVVGHHRGVIDYIDQLSSILEVDESSVFGNQSPLHFDASMKDIFPTMKLGATTWLLDHDLFLYPVKLIEYLNDHKINTICWVASILSLVSSIHTFDEIKPNYLHTIAFGSEIFPVKQFNIWKETLPQANFYNLYGPTETTGISSYYKVEKQFQEEEIIPIGYPCNNTEIILLKEGNERTKVGEVGEICIRGTCLTHGYYGNLERTKEVFVQNPLNPFYPEYIYRTGDLGKLNEDGELVFISRKDFQIKHMGHRIELGEIDANVTMIEGVRAACCIYHKEDEKIVLSYAGEIEKGSLIKELKKKLPRKMIPNTVLQLEQLPLTPNGKMNRKEMEKIYIERKKKRRR